MHVGFRLNNSPFRLVAPPQRALADSGTSPRIAEQHASSASPNEPPRRYRSHGMVRATAGSPSTLAPSTPECKYDRHSR
jgi:hypothetical protein